MTICRMSFRQTAFCLMSIAKCQSVSSVLPSAKCQSLYSLLPSPDIQLQFTEVNRHAEVLRQTAYNLVYILSRVTWRFTECHFAKQHFAEWQHQLPLFLAAPFDEMTFAELTFGESSGHPFHYRSRSIFVILRYTCGPWKP